MATAQTKAQSATRQSYTTRISTGSNTFTLTVDGNLFAAGFAVGLILGKLLLRNTMLAVAFGMGLGLAVGTSGGPLTALPAPQPTALSFTDVLGPVREGMRAVVTSGTATALGSLPAAGKTGTAQDNALAAGTYHNWMTAVAPHDDPRVVVTALVQGPGGGANSAKNVVADGLRHFLDHQGEVLATDLLQSP